MTPIDTAELERLAASITPGPWDVDGEDQGSAWGMAWSVHAAPNILNVVADGVDCEDDARAIALVPALIREVLAHRKAEAWQPISSAPKGCITEDAGCRGPSEWFLGRVSPEFRAGRPPFIVIRRKAWPQGHSWECAGEAWYVPRFFDAWRPLPTTPEAEGGCDAE
ncbi:hypothetical protein [Paracoccus sp. AS002]|uniref:hypothetical protein n=1 Tax=Paracoccus sp. AS002 TaxID=3019545 RepID=UPI0023E87036|nr:hypothetical protein [Paracoccus sp. AS002]MDF3904652.1 hypothetical protein [Paracoccus sp. AS002]